MPTPHHPSSAVQRALRSLGADLRDARKRRELPMQIVAERAFTSRSTLQRVESGDPSVSIVIYAAVMQALGLLDGLGTLADINNDPVGKILASAALPKRVHLKSKSIRP
ncbi:MAG: helix-turn-helix domain-containing protein [Hyphomonadaceae bacterium]